MRCIRKCSRETYLLIRPGVREGDGTRVGRDVSERVQDVRQIAGIYIRGLCKESGSWRVPLRYGLWVLTEVRAIDAPAVRMNFGGRNKQRSHVPVGEVGHLHLRAWRRTLVNDVRFDLALSVDTVGVVLECRRATHDLRRIDENDRSQRHGREEIDATNNGR